VPVRQSVKIFDAINPTIHNVPLLTGGVCSTGTVSSIVLFAGRITQKPNDQRTEI